MVCGAMIVLWICSFDRCLHAWLADLFTVYLYMYFVDNPTLLSVTPITYFLSVIVLRVLFI